MCALAYHQGIPRCYLTELDADDAKIEKAFHEAIRAAQQQKSISLTKRAEASYTEYRCQKVSDRTPFRLPLTFILFISSRDLNATLRLWLQLEFNVSSEREELRLIRRGECLVP